MSREIWGFGLIAWSVPFIRMFIRAENHALRGSVGKREKRSDFPSFPGWV